MPSFSKNEVTNLFKRTCQPYLTIRILPMSDNAELALVKLMELFNHSSVAITKRHLRLKQEEILQI